MGEGGRGGGVRWDGCVVDEGGCGLGWALSVRYGLVGGRYSTEGYI